ncbi:MAG TPA: hypothetical protein VGL66_05215 [Caulobacteraceae bacterium]|jgi:hypothetical protein
MKLNQFKTVLRRSRTGIITGIAGAGLIACLGLAVFWLGHSAEWAAWAQAFGTVAAVVAAGRIARRQSDEAAQRELGATQARLLTASRLATLFAVRVGVFIDGCKDGVTGRNLNPKLLRSFESSVGRLNRFPLEALVDPHAVVCFTQVLEGAEYVLIWFKDTNDILERFPDRRVETINSGLPHLKALFVELQEWEVALRRLAEPEWVPPTPKPV